MDGVSPYFDVVILADMTIFFFNKVYSFNLKREKKSIYFIVKISRNINYHPLNIYLNHRYRFLTQKKKKTKQNKTKT